MARKFEINLPPADDLFSTQDSREDAKREQIYNIPLDDIDDFPDHPFHVRLDVEMENIVESVKQYGILTPVVLRQKEDDRYELISGHRRKKACELAGIPTLPSIIRTMTRDEAIIFMVDSNLQRETVLPSEKAFSYKMRLDAMKRQGKRTDLTSTPLGQKLENKYSIEILGEAVGDSKSQVQRYIRLTELIPEILQMVDDSIIKMRPAVEISYLTKEEQTTLFSAMNQEECTPSYVQAMKMKHFSQEGQLNDRVILSIIQEEKPNQKEKIKLPTDRISKYFKAGTPAKKIEDTIIKALEFYQKRQRDRDLR